MLEKALIKMWKVIWLLILVSAVLGFLAVIGGFSLLFLDYLGILSVDGGDVRIMIASGATVGVLCSLVYFGGKYIKLFFTKINSYFKNKKLSKEVLK